MLQITEAAVMDALRHVQEPELGGDLVTRNMIRDLAIDGAKVAFQIELDDAGLPAQGRDRVARPRRARPDRRRGGRPDLGRQRPPRGAADRGAAAARA